MAGETEDRGSPDRMASELRRLREGRGLSLSALARQAGIHKATLSRWEAGIRRPGIPELETVLTTLRATSAERLYLLRLLEAAGKPRAMRLLRKETQEGSMPFGDDPPGRGDLLRSLRLRRGWLLEQVAQPLGVTPSAVSRWERGEAWPDGERLRAILAVLKASPAEEAALTAGYYLLSQDAEIESGLDALEYQFRSHLAPLLRVSEMHTGLDLSFLRLESSLWSYAVQRPSVRPLLGEVYAHHANYLRNWQRFTEAGVYARKALTVADDLMGGRIALTQTPRLPEWVESVAVCAADVTAQGGGLRYSERGGGYAARMAGAPGSLPPVCGLDVPKAIQLLAFPAAV